MTELLKGPIYEYSLDKKRQLFSEAVLEVALHHVNNCTPYRKICQKKGISFEQSLPLEEIPYLPTSIFKDNLILSIPEENVFREIQSSATTSGKPSRIGLDKENNIRWSRSLQRMLLNRIGNVRYKTMILDDESALGRSSVVSARASMTRSLLFSSSEIENCLVSEDGKLVLDQEKLDHYLTNLGDGTNVMLFGFTFILYTHVIVPLLESGKKYNLPNLKVIHAGGWKKLEAEKVDSQKLINRCCQCFGTKPENIIDIYGFSEQGGLLYPTCEAGVRHTPAWSEVFCRDPLSLEVVPYGKEGLMQYMTPIQTSYPGHSILTEDVGVILGHDNCSCGRKGSIFKVVGRSLAATEERGCGEIMANQFA
jgi:phenylacetate-coenzyme A ligase PaaK-like adenylate-forming protein